MNNEEIMTILVTMLSVILKSYFSKFCNCSFCKLFFLLSDFGLNQKELDGNEVNDFPVLCGGV